MWVLNMQMSLQRATVHFPKIKSYSPKLKTFYIYTVKLNTVLYPGQSNFPFVYVWDLKHKTLLTEHVLR
jgi:hypothetical protein